MVAEQNGRLLLLAGVVAVWLHALFPAALGELPNGSAVLAHFQLLGCSAFGL